MYFFTLIIPFVFKSLAALVNISNDTGSDLTSFALSFGVGSRQRVISIVLEGISVATSEVAEPIQEAGLVHPVEFVIVWKQWQV